MSGWRSRAGAVLVSLLAVPPAYATAQTPPSGDGEAVGPPIVLTPPSPATDEDTAIPAPSGDVGRAPAGIEVDPLAETAADYGGVLEPATGGLPLDMWRGSDRGFVERLLPAIPVAPQSPALRDLTRRLLLSSAEAPAGPAERNLAPVRAERLMALGDVEGAADLLALVPDSQVDPSVARLRLEAAWLAGAEERACREVQELVRRFDQDLYLQKALIFCQAREGHVDEATLGLDLLRELGHADETGFFELVEVLTGVRETADVEALVAPRGLHLAMLKAGGQRLPEGIGDAVDPDLLALRLAEAKDGPARLAATEEAVALGLAEPAELARLYREEATTPDELADALDAEPDSPHRRAALYQAAEQAQSGIARAALIGKALRAARRDDGYGTAARLYLPLIESMLPGPTNAAFAGEAGRALYLGGRYELAAAWLEVASAEAGRNPDAAEALPALLVLARIAGGALPLVWDGQTVNAWRQARSASGDVEADLRTARLFAVLEGLGEANGAAWRALGDPAAPNAAPLPYPALWFAVGDSAADGRVAETVMLSLFILGPDGPGEAHPVALSRALSALRQVGLAEEARSIAFEAALASGV